jgi:membrane-bound inhibitor of C-type lysozyme
MNMKRNFALLLAMTAATTGCSSVSVWPFGEESGEGSTAPANSVEYQCAEGRKFYLRSMDKGAAMWVILSEREFSLPKVESGERYSNGVSTLTITDGVAKLEESPTSTYSDCKVPEKKKD